MDSSGCPSSFRIASPGRNPVAAIDRPEDFSLWIDGVWDPIFSWTLDCAAGLGQAQRSSAFNQPNTVLNNLLPLPNGRQQPFLNIHHHQGSGVAAKAV